MSETPSRNEASENESDEKKSEQSKERSFIEKVTAWSSGAGFRAKEWIHDSLLPKMEKMGSEKAEMWIRGIEGDFYTESYIKRDLRLPDNFIPNDIRELYYILYGKSMDDEIDTETKDDEKLHKSFDK